MKNKNRKNIFKGLLLILFLTITFLFDYAYVAAYDEDSGDDDPTAVAIEQNITQKREKSPAMKIKQVMEAKRPRLSMLEEKFTIKEVNIVGSTLLAEEAVDKLKWLYTNKVVTGYELQATADRINRAYSRHGFITSYAYVVPEKLSQGILQIVVVEARTGKIQIQGNKYYSTDLLRKKITLKEGQLFNFTTLSLDIFRMNRHQDRKANFELIPGPGDTTDVIVTVKDKSPLHANFIVDNYGAETILYNRYKMFFTHNNISGHDDILTAKVELSEAYSHQIYDLDYTLPINKDWKFNFYLLPYKKEDYYYKDNQEMDFEKRARKFYFWFYQSLINKPDVEFVSGYNFTYFDIFWYKPYDDYDNRTRRDSFRFLRWKLALNKADRFGRWIFDNDFQIGIPRFMGGAPRKSDESSVVGARGDYKKNLLTIARRQKLVAGIDFLAKARWQKASGTLTGVNTFSIGGYQGVIDNRGYPRTQLPADEGRALNLGFQFPAYFIPKGINAPLSKTKLYNAVSLFTFWDWGQGIMKSPKLATVAGDPSDKKITTLSSAGVGLTYTVPDQSLAIRVDAGWPLTHRIGVDGDHHHVWFSATKGF